MPRKSKFGFRLKLIWAVQSVAQKYFCFVFSEGVLCLPHPGPPEGRLANVTIRWAGDAVDARASSATDDRMAHQRERSMRAGRAALKTSPSGCGGGWRETLSFARLVARFADGEIVLSWRPKALAPSPSEAESFAEATVANGMVHRGERV